MTQEEYNELFERFEKAKIYKTRIKQIESSADSIRLSGLRIATTGWETHSVSEYLSPQLIERITQMVINALNAKREELQKEFDKL